MFLLSRDTINDGAGARPLRWRSFTPTKCTLVLVCLDIIIVPKDIFCLLVDLPTHRNEVTFTEDVSPICLPEEDEHFPSGTKLTITGWGDTQRHYVRGVKTQLCLIMLARNTLEEWESEMVLTSLKTFAESVPFCCATLMSIGMSSKDQNIVMHRRIKLGVNPPTPRLEWKWRTQTIKQHQSHKRNHPTLFFHVTLSGFQTQPSLPDVLYEAVIQILPDQTCARLLSRSHYVYTHNTFCAGNLSDATPSATCQVKKTLTEFCCQACQGVKVRFIMFSHNVLTKCSQNCSLASSILGRFWRSIPDGGERKVDLGGNNQLGIRMRRSQFSWCCQKGFQVHCLD